MIMKAMNLRYLEEVRVKKLKMSLCAVKDQESKVRKEV